MIKLGEYVKLEVIRKSDLGYMLSDGESDILLHFRQSITEHNDGDKVNVFIYADKARRLTATEIEPTVTMSHPGYVTVTEIMNGVGVFVNMNTPKDILISKDYLPYDENQWPQIGDKLFVNLKIKKDTLTAKPINRYDIVALHKNVVYEEKQHVNGIVIRIAEKGLGIITDDLMYVFVPNTQLRGNHRLGEALEVTITKALEEEYYGTLNKQKEEMIDTDKEIIINYMKNHHNLMKITAKTSAEIVERELKISRKAFKRAYGGLYKDRIIDFDEDKTFFVKK